MMMKKKKKNEEIKIKLICLNKSNHNYSILRYGSTIFSYNVSNVEHN